jgi:hypothetical protein
LAAGALLPIIASGFCIYYIQFATPAANRELHEAVGGVMAEETARVVGRPGKVVIVTAELPEGPELKIQVASFEKHLKLLGGIGVQNKIVLDVGDNLKYRPGAGLSAKHFLKIARKNSGADAIVSFVGAPELTDSDLRQLRSMPRVIAETHSPEKLVNLLDKKILVAAIVPRFEFPAPGPRKPQKPRQWFDRYFQVVDAESRPPIADAAP